MANDEPDWTFPLSHDQHRRQQVRIGLALSAAERLAWLEEMKSTMARWCGRARSGIPR